eukprot:TRINITY_DN774162_c0_g1_i1.p1 TRINITY_DN774162_c0_g1~~TRINITY_DN774162_c0_g1_i1.p1  ORF type:complete len:533 (-),score=204.58 TRINITY_DN774162_c0_g1_i1:218-1816(-)
MEEKPRNLPSPIAKRVLKMNARQKNLREKSSLLSSNLISNSSLLNSMNQEEPRIPQDDSQADYVRNLKEKMYFLNMERQFLQSTADKEQNGRKVPGNVMGLSALSPQSPLNHSTSQNNLLPTSASGASLDDFLNQFRSTCKNMEEQHNTEKNILEREIQERAYGERSLTEEVESLKLALEEKDEEVKAIKMECERMIEDAQTGRLTVEAELIESRKNCKQLEEVLQDTQNRLRQNQVEFEQYKVTQEVSLQRVTDRSNESVAKIQELTSKLATSEASLNETTEKLVSATGETDNKKTECDSLITQLGELKAMVTELNIENEDLQKKAEEAIEKRKEALKQSAISKETTNSIQNQLTHQDQRMNSLRKELSKARGDFASAQMQAEQAIAIKQAKEEALVLVKREQESAQKVIVQRDGDITLLKEQNMRLQGDLNQLKSEWERAIESESRGKAKNEVLENRVSELQQRVSGLEERITQVNESKRDVEKQLSDTVANKEKENKITEIQKRFQDLLQSNMEMAASFKNMMGDESSS